MDAASCEIRRARAEDVGLLVDFNARMAWETEEKRLDREVLAAGVAGLLANPDAGFYLVAELEGTPCASLMITQEWSDWRNGSFWWIQSVYVVPEARRRGVYRAMYEHVKTLAVEDPSTCGFRLYVERSNRGARRTYERLGMVETTYRLYEAPR